MKIENYRSINDPDIGTTGQGFWLRVSSKIDFTRKLEFTMIMTGMP
jgi:hypothetical protein